MSKREAPAGAGSWLSAHGRLWYDDRWYRLAWIVWPQAIGLLLFSLLWLHQPGQGFIPWARPIAETPKNPPVAAPVRPPIAPPLAEKPADVMAPCASGEFADRIAACTSLLASGNLKGSNVAQAYYHRGWAYHSTNQYQQAMGDYDRAISIAPAVPEFYNDRGVLWRELGNNERAMQDFDQAILLKPSYALSYTNRGIALRSLNRPDEALVALSRAIELDSRQWLAFQTRSFIYEDRSNSRGRPAAGRDRRFHQGHFDRPQIDLQLPPAGPRLLFPQPV
jgi:tetratricopeptide (TPR) repeat protein